MGQTSFGRWTDFCIPFCVLLVSAICCGADPASRPNRIGGILYNEDDEHRFILDAAGAMKPERLDQVVDELAGSKVTTMLICCCSKNTAFDSKVWHPQCKGFDPTKDNNQPYFCDSPPDVRPELRTWAHNQLIMFQAGIDPVGRMIDRCRQRKISPWVSIRMNDVHDADLLKSPLHSDFWLQHPEYWRYPNRFTAWNDRCLDYGQKPVRDHTMALIKEVCERYDMDGLELDWNRFPLHFREGEEIEKGKELTAWMEEVRQVVRAAEKKWGHPIVLAARVPARPEVSMGTGLDAITWAKQHLIDHLIVAPFWATTDFDIPVEQWNDLLKGTGVGVTAGLEIRIQPYPGGPVLPNTPERRRGAAMAALARGSQGIYLFNYFIDVASAMPYLLREIHSVDALRDKDRSYIVTYVDISIPGRPIPPALPKILSLGASAEFRIFIGPAPVGARGEVTLGVKGGEPVDKKGPKVVVNGHPAELVGGSGLYQFDGQAFVKDYNTVQVTNTNQSTMIIENVELSIRFSTSK